VLGCRVLAFENHSPKQGDERCARAVETKTQPPDPLVPDPLVPPAVRREDRGAATRMDPPKARAAAGPAEGGGWRGRLGARTRCGVDAGARRRRQPASFAAKKRDGRAPERRPPPPSEAAHAAAGFCVAAGGVANLAPRGGSPSLRTGSRDARRATRRRAPLGVHTPPGATRRVGEEAESRPSLCLFFFAWSSLLSFWRRSRAPERIPALTSGYVKLCCAVVPSGRRGVGGVGGCWRARRNRRAASRSSCSGRRRGGAKSLFKRERRLAVLCGGGGCDALGCGSLLGVRAGCVRVDVCFLARGEGRVIHWAPMTAARLQLGGRGGGGGGGEAWWRLFARVAQQAREREVSGPSDSYIKVGS